MLHKAIGRTLKIGTLISTWGLIATVLLQIICRFTPIDTPSWTEEASRLFFIYAMSFAAGLAMKNEFYVHLSMFYNQFPSRFKKIVSRTIPILSLVLFSFMGVCSVQLIILGLAEKSPSMGLNMGFAFLSMFIMASSVGYYLARKITRGFKNKKS